MSTITDNHSDSDFLNRVRIAAPCAAKWESMPGGERVRSCAQCGHKVYNLSEMTAAEAADLICGAEGRVCVRLYRRADGSVMTRDCPRGLRAARQRVARAATLAFASAFSLVGLFSLADRMRGSAATEIPAPAVGADLPVPVVLGTPAPIPDPTLHEGRGFVMGEVAVRPMTPLPMHDAWGQAVVTPEPDKQFLPAPPDPTVTREDPFAPLPKSDKVADPTVKQP